jgi:choline dehydrogenase-like flavoprotein
MPQEKTDVLIIGAGHTGAMAAKMLTEKGIKCTILNAGPMLDYQKDHELKPAFELPYHGMNQPGRLSHVWQTSEFSANLWQDEKEVPYTYPTGKTYNWVRVRMLGGRSLLWGRQSYRLSDYEFKSKDHDGYGDNWPIDLAELSPFYSRAESLLQVRSRIEGVASYPDGNYLPDNDPWSESMEHFKTVAKKKNVPVCKMRIAQGRDGLASSLNLMLPDAMATGKLTLVPNAIVRELTIDKKTGLVDGARYVERHSRRELEIKARVVIVAAGTLESTRLLLNSGVANSSGVLGHYLQDQMYGAGIACSVPAARDGKAKASLMGGSGIIPRFRNVDTKEKNFLGGYALTVGSSKGSMDPRTFAEYGAGLDKKMDSYYGSGFHLGLMGAILARRESNVSINKTIVDAWGIPVLHIDTKYTENEHNLVRDAIDTASSLAEDAGYEVLIKNYEVNPPGYSIHEQGTARMGNDPKTSVLNKWNQSHDIKNLFVVDASCFVTCGWQNPTLTMIALTIRSSEYLLEQMRTGNV